MVVEIFDRVAAQFSHLIFNVNPMDGEKRWIEQKTLISHQTFEAILEERCHRSVQMPFHTA